jgi:hypothetical protein
MHGDYFWRCGEIGSHASEAARIITEWSCIDEGEWMERRRRVRRKDRRQKRTRGGGKRLERFRDLVGYGKGIVQIMVDEHRDAQIDNREDL